MPTPQRIITSVLRVGVCLLLASTPVASQPVSPKYWVSQLGQDISSHTYTASYYGVAKASYQLGEYYWHQQQRARALDYYRHAVTSGNADAAYRLASYIPSQRQRWLRQAADLGHYEAILKTVAETLRSDPERAQQQLDAITLTPSIQHELTHVLFNHPWLETRVQWQDIIPADNYWRAQLKLAAQLAVGNHALAADSQCHFTLALHSSGGNARSTLYHWLSKLKAHPLAEVGLCITESIEPIACMMDSKSHLECVTETGANADAQVFVVDLATLANSKRHSGSIARVRDTAMSLSSEAEFSVFIHELGHLLGLADEYAMSAPLARAFCSGQYQFSALNIVVTSAREVSLDQLDELNQRLPWLEHLQQPIAQHIVIGDDVVARLGSQDESKVGLFATDTCDGTLYQAWRPVAERTFMQQHEVGTIPELYLRLIGQRLREAH